jgi:hypothetical protein
LVPVALAPAIAAQDQQARFSNPSRFRRREWGLATIPFPQGVWQPNAEFRPEGLEGELTPFGALWPDGSVRYAQLAVRLDLAPGQEHVVRIVAGAPALPSFRVAPWLAHGLSQFNLVLAAGVNGQMEVAPLVPKALVHNSEVRKTVYCSARIPNSDLIYDLWLSFFHDQDHVPFELRVTNSRAGSQVWRQELEWLALGTQGAMPSVRGHVSRGVRTIEMTPTRAVIQLLGPTHIWDGQAQDWWGNLLCVFPEVATDDPDLRGNTAVAAVATPFYGCATNWHSSGALGPFGHVPAHPPWVTDVRYTMSLERGKFDDWYRVPGLPWDDLPRALFKQASSSGDQHDFGVVKMLPIFATGLPINIEEARHASSEEAHRPDHHREADGRMVTSANRPNWVAWNGRTHFNRTVSSDRLGKPFPEPWPETHGWGGRDNQHWSSLTLAAGYLLTRSYSLEMDIETQVELYLAGHTLPSMKPGWSTNGIDSSRGIGRSLLTLSWHYMLTGRADLRERMSERIRQCIAQLWTGRNVPGPVRPLTHSSPDSRIIANYDFWRPWEDALGIVGLEAAYRVTGRQEARDIAAIVAKTLFTYGWRVVGSNGAEIATGLRWIADGTPLSQAALDDPSQAVWGAGVGFEMWALPAAKLARQYARERGDADLEFRADFCIASINRSRIVPFNRRWDQFYEWDAIQ